MEPQVFYRTIHEFKWRRPYYIWSVVTFGPIVLLGIYSLFTSHWLAWVGILLIVPLLWFTIYQFFKGWEARINRWKTFVITIDDKAIHRDFMDEPRKTILRSDVRKVEKLRDHGIRINGNENSGLWVPSDMIGYKNIVEIIEVDLKTTVSDASAQIVDEQKPESFVSFLKVIQENFGGISLFTTIIIFLSYVKIYFNYALYGINVNSYIDVSEIILSITPVIFELVILSILFGAFYRTFEFVKLKKGKPLTGLQEFLSHFQIGIVLIMSGYFYYHAPNFVAKNLPIGTIYLQFAVLLSISLAVIFTVFIVYLHTMRIRTSARLVTMNSTSITLLITFLLIIIAESRMSYALNKSGHPKYDVRLELNNGTYVASRDSLLYVGSTSNYYFFHNFKTENNAIIPKSSVLKENQKQLRIGL